MTNIITFAEFASRQSDENHYVRNWGGWSTLSRTIEENIDNTYAVFDNLNQSVHETDFLFYGNFPEKGMFLDIGANMGFSAISFSNVNKTMDILSLEILPLLAPVLQNVASRIGSRMSFKIIGAGREGATLNLFVPVVGSLICSTMASLSVDKKTIDELQERLISGGSTGRVDVLKLNVEVIAVDDLNLDPTFIKIDTEQHEHDALLGLEKTVNKSRPIFMLESGGAQDQACRDWLRARNYRRYVYNHEKNILWQTETAALNAFFVPDEKVVQVRKSGVSFV